MSSPLPGVLLMTGVAFVAYGLATGKVKLRDVKGVLAILAGTAGFVVAGRLLPAETAAVVGTAFLIPAFAYSIYQSRRVVAESRKRIAAQEAALVDEARGTHDPALALMAEANLEDFNERRSQTLWRKLRRILVLPVTMASVGAINGDLKLALFGGLVGLIPPVGVLMAARFGAPIIDGKKKLKGAV